MKILIKILIAITILIPISFGNTYLTSTINNSLANERLSQDNTEAVNLALFNTSKHFQTSPKHFKPVMELYTDFQKITGQWDKFGTIDSTSNLSHSQLLPIRPNTQYYVGYKSKNNNTRAAFFDKTGKYISHLTDRDLTEHSYRKPDATNTFKNYVQIFTFTSPVKAKFISLNLTDDPNYNYREYISSKPVFALAGTGNYLIPANDKIYRKYNKRKLCMIGTSQLMTDRLLRKGNFNEYGENVSQYVVGIPEYLLLWWKTCDVYGYSNASMMPIPGEKVLSLYERIVTNHLNLSQYDDFLITHSSVGIGKSNIGSLKNPSDLGDNKTLIGAIRQIVAYIYTQNPKAKIYVQTRIIRSSYSNATRLSAMQQANEQIREMCNMLNLVCLDCERNSGFNQQVAPQWCYDKAGHYNHLGSKMMGLSIRKTILGF